MQIPRLHFFLPCVLQGCLAFVSDFTTFALKWRPSISGFLKCPPLSEDIASLLIWLIEPSVTFLRLPLSPRLLLRIEMEFSSPHLTPPHPKHNLSSFSPAATKSLTSSPHHSLPTSSETTLSIESLVRLFFYIRLFLTPGIFLCDHRRCNTCSYTSSHHHPGIQAKKRVYIQDS